MKRKKKLVQCATRVNREAVRRESINGVEHVIISSFTLPDNIVMNGGLYPAEEIAKSFQTLERTLAPIEHPTDANGNFISASDPEAIHNFHAGAFNTNVSREGGRVHVEKFVNVQEALKTERGKRLMDRIEELETNDSPRPVHTSVGVFLEVEFLDKPQKNNMGDEFTWIAREMFFDHDAILLDNVGAAQPADGVGMAVNAAGEEIETEVVDLGEQNAPEPMPARPGTQDMRGNADGASFAQIMDTLQHEIQGVVAADWVWLADVFADFVIFETPQGFFQVPWTLNNGIATLAGIPIRVDRVVSYQPKTNGEKGEELMFKKIILNALAAAGVKTDGLSDEELTAKYNELQAEGSGGGEGDAIRKVMLNALTEAGIKTDGLSDDDLLAQYNGLHRQGEGDEAGDAIGKAVANALKPLTDKVDGLVVKINAQETEETAQLIGVVVNSGKYAGLDEAGAKALPLATLKEMAANCGTAHGLPINVNDGGQQKGFESPDEMPD